METIAVYWEALIKTYGLDVQTNLVMLSVTGDLNWMVAHWTRATASISHWGRMVLAFARPAGPGRLRLHLLFSSAGDAGPMPALPLQEHEVNIHIDKPVDLIQFHGPHFGDRYGIAAAAMAALETGQVPIKAAACCSASVHLVVPAGSAQLACKALSKAFTVPEPAKHSSRPRQI
jgi:hypothetical protein